jgi:hypothetical protein
MQTSNGKTVMVQGRIVWTPGNLFTGRGKVDQNTKQPKLNLQGQQRMEYGFGLAIAKTDLAPGKQGYALWEAMHVEASSLYQGGQIPPGFAMKFKDGDGIDDKGQPFANREGYAGHIVVAMTTEIPIKFVKWENGTNIQVNEGIKCGDYVNVQVQVKAHPANGSQKPGLYINPMMAQFIGYGKEIINTASGDQVFGNQAPPMMGSATPIAPQGGLLMPTGAPIGAPQGVPNMAPQMAPQAAPHFAVLPQNLQPAGMPGIPQAQPVPQPMAQPAMQPTGMPGIPGFPQR